MLKGFCGILPTYENIETAVSQINKKHKSINVIKIGQSVLGRNINALCIGHPIGSVLYVGATHGLEWLTAALLIRFCENAAESFETGSRLADINTARVLRKRGITIVPCLNPDGVEIALNGSDTAGKYKQLVDDICADRPCSEIWQANARGVDINHNFNAGWDILHKLEAENGITAPAATRYGGPHPHSEPETIAIAGFCVRFRPHSLYAIHSQGEEIYYKYGKNTPAKSKTSAQILSLSGGYSLAEASGLSAHGGLKDWFIEKTGKQGFTIEVGKGKNPLPLSSLDDIYNKTEEMLMIAALL